MGIQNTAEIDETIERASFVSSTTDIKLVAAEDYDSIKAADLIEGGALREGGAPDLYSRDHIGLLCQYAAVGVIYGAFPRTVYPFLNNYLNMDGYQAVAAYTLVMMPWSFKTFIGVVSDSFPIVGYRRRPYMVIGWSLCFVLLLVMAILPVDDPFYLDANDSGTPVDDLPPSRLNLDAPAQGSKYILLMMFASIGYVIADVAADGMVVEFAQREPEAIRGTTQTMIYVTRTMFSILSVILVGFCMNSKSYGGEFDWSLQFNQVMAILSVAAALVIPASIWLLKEEQAECVSFRTHVGEMWKIVQQRAIWQILALKFFSGIFSGFGAAPVNIVQRQWAHVQPLNDSIFTIVGYVVFAATLYVTKQYGLAWDWRWTIAWTTIVVILVDALVSFLTIFDVLRNQWFWLGVPILEELPVGIRFIISTYIVVEIADRGHEGATYGLITTVSNLSSPFSASIYKNVDAYFNAFAEDIKRDDDEARWQVAYTFIIMYVMKFLSIFWLILLPRQKKEAQELKRHGGSSKLAGVLTLVVGGFSLLWSIATNLMSIFPSTACYTIAGGSGCS